MNHYERLKVAPDAPAEVIRAAYRALASKIHPDRQGEGDESEQSRHDEMAALNTAFVVLMDAAQRAQYDASLSDTASTEISVDLDLSRARQRIDMNWLSATGEASNQSVLSGLNPVYVGLGVAALVLLGAGWFAMQVRAGHQMDQALSGQYSAPPALPALAAPQVTPGASLPRDRRPSVAELSQMTDEQLLEVLPLLDAETSAAKSTGVRSAPSPKHPLDGKPLSLRTDRQLIDPLAPLGKAAP